MEYQTDKQIDGQNKVKAKMRKELEKRKNHIETMFAPRRKLPQRKGNRESQRRGIVRKKQRWKESG